jgi:hypothetical protein
MSSWGKRIGSAFAVLGILLAAQSAQAATWSASANTTFATWTYTFSFGSNDCPSQAAKVQVIWATPQGVGPSQYGLTNPVATATWNPILLTVTSSGTNSENVPLWPASQGITVFKYQCLDGAGNVMTLADGRQLEPIPELVPSSCGSQSISPFKAGATSMTINGLDPVRMSGQSVFVYGSDSSGNTSMLGSAAITATSQSIALSQPMQQGLAALAADGTSSSATVCAAALESPPGVPAVGSAHIVLLFLMMLALAAVRRRLPAST